MYSSTNPDLHILSVIDYLLFITASCRIVLPTNASIYPSITHICKGVSPLAFLASNFTSYYNKYSNVSRQPPKHAECKAFPCFCEFS